MSQSDWDKNAVMQVIDSLKDKPGAMLPILHGIQDTLGYIPKGSVPLIASALNVSRAEVHGVITFYHYFRETPPGRHTIHLCRAESCQSMNGEGLEAHAKAVLGIDYHETTADGGSLAGTRLIRIGVIESNQHSESDRWGIASDGHGCKGYR